MTEHEMPREDLDRMFGRMRPYLRDLAHGSDRAAAAAVSTMSHTVVVDRLTACEFAALLAALAAVAIRRTRPAREPAGGWMYTPPPTAPDRPQELQAFQIVAAATNGDTAMIGPLLGAYIANAPQGSAARTTVEIAMIARAAHQTVCDSCESGL